MTTIVAAIVVTFLALPCILPSCNCTQGAVPTGGSLC